MDITKTTKQEYQKNVCSLVSKILEILKLQRLDLVDSVLFEAFLQRIVALEFKPEELLIHLENMTAMQKVLAEKFQINEEINTAIEYLKNI